MKLLLAVTLFASLAASTAHADTIQYTGEGNHYDLGLEQDGKAMRVFLADKMTNQPVAGQIVEYVPHEEGDEVKFTDAGNGVYMAFLEGEIAGQIVVNYEKSDEDTIELERPGHEGHNHAEDGSHESGHDEKEHQDDEHEESVGHTDEHDHGGGVLGHLQHVFEGPTLWFALIIGLAFFLSGWILGRRQGRNVIAGILLGSVVSAAGVITETAQASPGHSHAEVSVGAPGEGTTVRITKKSQFLVGLQTVVAKSQSNAGVFLTFGHTVAKPQLDAVIRAPRDGVLRGIEENIWGKLVRKGDIIARIDAVGLVPIQSPVSGTVIQASGVSGARISAGEQIMRIVDTNKLWVDAEVFQKDLAKVRSASSVYVSLDSGGSLVEKQARLVGAQTIVDEHTMAGKIFLEIDNKDGALSIGNTVQVQFRLDDVAVDGFLLPHSAVLHRGAETIVYVKTGAESFEPKPVAYQAGPEPGTVVVTKGLNNGDRVVVAGNYQLLVGAR